MKKQEKTKLHQQTISELTLELEKLQKLLVSATQNLKLNKEKNLKKANQIRKKIAVIKTIIREKQLNQS